MSYSFVSTDYLQPRETIPFPTIGGLDLAVDKLTVHPGTLQSVMNYEVTKEMGYTQSPGLLRWNGTTTYTVLRYLTADFPSDGLDDIYVGGIYTIESEYTGTTAKIKILKKDYTENKICFQIIDGEWAIDPKHLYQLDSSNLYGVANGSSDVLVYSVFKQT